MKYRYDEHHDLIILITRSYDCFVMFSYLINARHKADANGLIIGMCENPRFERFLLILFHLLFRRIFILVTVRPPSVGKRFPLFHSLAQKQHDDSPPMYSA